MSRQIRHGSFGSGPFLVLLLTCGWSSAPAIAQTPPRPEREAKREISIHVYNYSKLSAALMRNTEQEASAVFARAGMSVAWVDCPLSASEVAKFPACSEGTNSRYFVIRLLPESMVRLGNFGDNTYGLAMFPADGSPAYIADIFSERMASAAHAGNISECQTMGYAIAHEVGHLLLGPGSHSDNGLMRAAWGDRDFEHISKENMLFNSKESETIRSELLLGKEQGMLDARNAHSARNEPSSPVGKSAKPGQP